MFDQIKQKKQTEYKLLAQNPYKLGYAFMKIIDK